MLATWLVAAASLVPVQVSYTGFGGLQMSANGIPVVVGSSFQYYERGWTRGIYSSVWSPQEVYINPNQSVEVRYQGDDGRVIGRHTYTPTPTGAVSDFRLRWRGTKPVMIENSAGILWAEPFIGRSVSIDGLRYELPSQGPRAGTPVEDRVIGSPAGVFEFEAAYGTLRVTADPPQATLIDGRNYNQPWAEDRRVFWLGYQDQEIEPDGTLPFRVTYEVLLKPGISGSGEEPLATTPEEHPAVAQPTQEPFPLIPQPREVERSNSFAQVAQEFEFRFPAVTDSVTDEFETLLWTRWARNEDTLAAEPMTIEAELNPALQPEEYRLGWRGDNVMMDAGSELGLRHGLRTLVGLVRPRNGQLVFEKAEVEDAPALGWRGVHLFVGPTAPEFHTRLVDRVLAPLKFNNVVLQAERTRWDTVPGIETSITAEKDDIREMIAMYRSHGFEPIPLIQSFGHMGWLFANDQNLDIAFNREVPFTIDPRKARSREVLKGIWAETLELFDPPAMHFGLDEVSMRGFPDDPFLVNRLWTRHVPWLMDLAEGYDKPAVLWGDKMLAPGEAPDATHADSVVHAQLRRDALDAGSWIADWHYRADANPDIFTSLELWRDQGHRPIASTWFRPENIYGFTHAAVDLGGDAGLLQTTWAGYESNEFNMIRELPQFAAFLLAADYSWSGREELPSELPYDFITTFRRMYFESPARVVPAPGTLMSLPGPAREQEVAGTLFRLAEAPFPLHSAIREEQQGAPEAWTMPIGQAASQLYLALDCTAWKNEGEDVAVVTVRYADGTDQSKTLRYGHHLRTSEDERPVWAAAAENGLSAVAVEVDPEQTIETVRVEAASNYGGLRLYGLTLL